MRIGIKLRGYSASLVVLFGILSMSTANAGPSRGSIEGFSISPPGEHQSGTNAIGVRMNGEVRIGLSDTITRDDIVGVGSYINRLSPDDVTEARELHHLLCENAGMKAESNSESRPATAYSAICMNGQESATYRGKLNELPIKVQDSALRFYRRLQEAYVQDGRADVKLDVTVDSVVRKDGKFLVSVRFMNSGDYPMATRSPERWTGSWGQSLLWIYGTTRDDTSKWTADLSGLALVNKSEFPDEIVTIPPRSSVTFQFLTMPDEKIKAGTYRFDARVFMGISSDNFPVNSMGKVAFHSDYKNPYRVTFDRDYPSTPDEWKDFESRKAKEVSFLAPGDKVTEPGYYRMVSVFGPRSQFVTRFEAGTEAAKLDYQNWDRWEWESDLARATTCKPGEACPRDGRWIMRSWNFRSCDSDAVYSQQERRARTGDELPVIDMAAAGHSDHLEFYWEWLGA